MITSEELLSSSDDEFHLACLLLSPTGRVHLGSALDAVDPEDFNNPTWGWLWAAARNIYTRGDRVTKRTLLAMKDGTLNPSMPMNSPAMPTLRSHLEQISGEPVYVHKLQSSIQTVQETAKLRNLIRTTDLIRSQAFTASTYSQALGTAVELLGKLDGSELPPELTSFANLVDDFHKTMAGSRSVGEIIPTPWLELNDLLSGGLHAGRSFVAAGRPGAGKSILGLGMAAHAAEQGFPTLVISEEMSNFELTGRILAAGAKVEYGEITRYSMSAWTAEAVAEYGKTNRDMPLYVIDRPNLTIEYVAAVARTMKRDTGLDLLVIDYLQLLEATDRSKVREQQVAHISRSVKLLSRELGCAIVTLAQLNRDNVKSSRKPTLADLRESGCLTRETTLLRADTGEPVTFGTLLTEGHQDVLVWSLDEDHKLVPAPVTNVFPSGMKETHRLTLASGRQVTASGNHQFLTFTGWMPLESLIKGDRIAVPRRIPAPINAGIGWSGHRLGLLAHLIGDGCVIRKQPVHYTSQDEDNLAFVEQAATVEFGITPRRVRQGNWQHCYLPAPHRCARGRRNPLHVWLAELGIENLRSYEKRIPNCLYQANDEEIRIFLRHLWATDGSVSPCIYYSTSSRALADGVALLLSRLAIPTRLSQVLHSLSDRPGYRVVVSGSTAMTKFCRDVGVYGQRGKAVREYLARPAVVANTNVDTLPVEVWDLVRIERVRAGLTDRQFQAAIDTHYCGTTLYKACPSRERLLRCAKALDSDILREVATDDVFWDKIVSIEPLGPQPVFDATVKGTHNFIADGVVAHNSLEQDADAVILLHHEETADGRPTGVVTLIVAKSRFGRKDEIELRWRGHQARIGD